MKQDGVFAKRNIREGELISYYSGVIFNPKNNPIFFKNQSIFEAWEAFSNSFYFKITSTIIFIKWEFKKYLTKVGVVFQVREAPELDQTEPRAGISPGTKTIKLFCHYWLLSLGISWDPIFTDWHVNQKPVSGGGYLRKVDLKRAIMF